MPQSSGNKLLVIPRACFSADRALCATPQAASWKENGLTLVTLVLLRERSSAPGWSLVLVASPGPWSNGHGSGRLHCEPESVIPYKVADRRKVAPKKGLPRRTMRPPGALGPKRTAQRRSLSR